jgi:Domain of unknown function (DUF4386)
MQPQGRLEYEARVRTRQVALAAAAGILLMLAVVIQLGGPHVNVNEQTLGLVTEDKRFVRDLIGSIANSFGSFALAWTLYYLFGGSRARDPNVRPRFLGILAIAGGVLSGISVVAYVISYGTAAHDFVNHGSQTYPEAHTLLTRTSLVVPQITNDLGLLLTAVSVVLVALNAMRVGLLTRFMGYLGIVAGVLTIIPLVPIPIVEAYWLLALAYLMSGRWPSGVPPAWSTGRAERWPSSQELRAARAQPAGRGGRGKPAPRPATEPVGAPAPSSTRATTPKRKRKRRR